MQFNKVILCGNLTRDPQLSYLPSQTSVCEIGLAVNRKWKDQSGNPKEEVCFIDCRAFGKTAENIQQYVKKGDNLFIEGRLSLDQWEGTDGTKRSKHRVTIGQFQFMGNKQAQAAPAAPRAPSEYRPDQAADESIPF